ncbi:MAG: hypothetical protein J6U48_02395 [Alistipes sp.]|nr:hypothetical protein [Alistipes sp.]
MKIFYTLLMAAMMLSFTGCSLDDLPFGPGNEQEQGKDDDNTGGEIPDEPLTSGPASVAITRATATTAHFEGSIINDDIDLDFVQITVRYAEPEDFSAMSEDIPSVVITRPDFENDKNFSFSIEDLHINTLYKFCAIVQYKSEVFYSDVEEFKTAGVDIELAVKEGSITDSSVEFIGSVRGLSPEDEGCLKIGLLYSDDKSLVEGGEGDMVVIDAIAEDGTFNLSLTSLYDGPTYYFRSYVEQNGDYILGEIDYFEFDIEPVRLVKKITRHEKIHGAEAYMVYEFEYNGRGNVISSKVTLTEDEYCDEHLFTYDYSTNGVVSVNGRTYYDGELYEEQTYKMNVNDRGYVSNYDYTWEDCGEIWYYTATFDYSEEGFLERWFVNGEDDEYFGLNYSYLDGCLMELSYFSDGDYNEMYRVDDSFTSDREIKRTSFDINKALIPWLYPDETLTICSTVNIGTLGSYYFDRMNIESFIYEIWNEDRIHHTYDANYKETSTFKFVYCEDYEGDFYTLPITTATYDKDGYPVEFIADIREYEGEMEATYAAGDILWEEEDGPVYEVVEVDRKIISKGPATSVGSATITIEYCE